MTKIAEGLFDGIEFEDANDAFAVAAAQTDDTSNDNAEDGGSADNKKQDNDDLDVNAAFEELGADDNSDSDNDDDDSSLHDELKDLENGDSGSDSNGGGTEDTSVFAEIAKAYMEDNGFGEDFNLEEFEETVKEKGGTKALFEFISKEVSAGVEEYKASLTPEQKTYLDAIEKGVNPEEYVKAYGNKLQYSKIDNSKLSEDEGLQKRIITESLKLRGFSEDEIADELDDYESLNKLEDKAQRALKVLQKSTEEAEANLAKEADLRIKKAKETQEAYISKLKEDITNTEEFLPGIKWNKKVKEKLIESMTTPAGENPQTGAPIDIVQKKMIEHPDTMRKMLHYLNQIGLFNFDKNGKLSPDISVIKNTVTTKVVDDLESKIKGKAGQFRSSQKSSNNNSSEVSARKNLDAMKSLFK